MNLNQIFGLCYIFVSVFTDGIRDHNLPAGWWACHINK